MGGERPSRRKAGGPQGLEKGASPGWRAQCRPWGHHVASVVLSPCGALEVGWRPPQKPRRQPVPSRGWGSNSGFTFGYEFNFKGPWSGHPGGSVCEVSDL